MKTTNSVNNEKKSRAIRETSEAEFMKSVNEVRDLINDEQFDRAICETTGNGLYKMTTTRPDDMTGVKSVEKSGLKWYKVPTSDYSVALFSYLKYRMTCEVKANSAALKQFADLSLDEKLALLAKLQELAK